MNRLYFGDNLDVLRAHVRDECVDLVYLDPPFNSNAEYNVIHRSPVGDPADAQKRVFKDMWRWEEDAAPLAMDDIRQRDLDLFRILQSLQLSLGTGDLMTYIVMMAVRLLELRRVLRATGSLYLHCDPKASHYIKVLLDVIFGAECFRSEIVWKRTTAHGASKKYAPIHDVVFFYSKSAKFTWNPPRCDYDQQYLDRYYKYDDGDGRLYWRADITGAGVRSGDSGRPWRGRDPTAINRHWALPQEVIARLVGAEKAKIMTAQEKLDVLEREGRIYWPKGQGMPQYKRYREELKGRPVGDIWDDIDRINPVGKERLGYQTQKPLALMERIIATSSNEGDLVLDPFCGCGTTIHAAEKLGRTWVGIDVAYDAILVIEDRLKKWSPSAKYVVDGIPTAEREALALARLEPHTFQEWAVGRLGGRSRGRGADRGIDGEIVFLIGRQAYGRAIISVKAGQNVNPGMIRDLAGVVGREGADLGVFVCVNEPTREMKLEASRSELVELPWGKVHRIQIVTVKDLIDGPNIGIPTALNSIEAAEHARAASRQRPPKRPTQEELREQPPLPPMGISGGKPKQEALPMEEPLLVRPTRAQGKRGRS